MNTDRDQICVNDISVDVFKKDIKNIHLAVYPPNGRVRIAAPTNTTNEALRLFLTSQIPWIKKQKKKFAKQERQTKSEFVSGESHYYWGNRYRLNILPAGQHQKVEITRKSFINLYAKQESGPKKKEQILDEFYRKELRKQISILIEKWQKTTGIQVKEFKIKKMKTRWGTCNEKAGRIWLNLELAKKPLHCLEYVVVHEMVHILEKKHTQKFTIIMDSFMPKWRQFKVELNQFPLSHSNWSY